MTTASGHKTWSTPARGQTSLCNADIGISKSWKCRIPGSKLCPAGQLKNWRRETTKKINLIIAPQKLAEKQKPQDTLGSVTTACRESLHGEYWEVFNNLTGFSCFGMEGKSMMPASPCTGPQQCDACSCPGGSIAHQLPLRGHNQQGSRGRKNKTAARLHSLLYSATAIALRV